MRKTKETTNPHAKSYWTKADTAAEFGVTSRTITDWMRKGILPFYRIGRSIRFIPSEVADAVSKLRHVGQTSGGAS